MRCGLTIATTCVLVALLSSCSLKGESALPYWRGFSYSEMKSRKPLSSEEWEKRYSECPKPDGIFKNNAEEKKSPLLENYFIVEGFEIPATMYEGGREDDEPLPSHGTPIDLLGGERNGIRQQFYRKKLAPPIHLLTLELRPLGLGRFRIGVKSDAGLSGASNRGLINLGKSAITRCENGRLKGFWTSERNNTIVMGWELFVDAESGDIVVHSPGGVFYSPQPLPERYHRFERIGE